MNHLQAGIEAEKDAGERGADHISAYAMLKDLPTGRRSSIREAIVGCFRAHFGLGLAINTGVSFGKNMMTGSMGRLDRGLSRHASTMETGYMTGAGLRYRIGCASVAAFGAYDKTDGTMLSDSSGISALKTDGLHRTPLEHSKRHNIRPSRPNNPRPRRRRICGQPSRMRLGRCKCNGGQNKGSKYRRICSSSS